MGDKLTVKVRLVHKQAKRPQYKTSGSAGADLSAAFSGLPIVIQPGQRANIPTGIRIEIHESLEAQVRPVLWSCVTPRSDRTECSWHN